MELKVILFEQDVSNMLGLPIKRVDTGRDMPIKYLQGSKVCHNMSISQSWSHCEWYRKLNGNV
jgi:hypothetical protein